MEVGDLRDERKIIVCGPAEKKRKFGDESDDSDDDKFKMKGKNIKPKKSRTKLTPNNLKRKC